MPRLIFWIAAGLYWIVWTLAVAAASDDKWLEVKGADGFTFAGGSDYWLGLCHEHANYTTTGDDNPITEDLDEFCPLCECLCLSTSPEAKLARSWGRCHPLFDEVP